MIELDGWRLEEPYWIGPNGERLKAISGSEVTTTTLLIIGAVAAAASTGVATYAAYEQGQQQQAAGKYNAKVAQNQALAAQQAAGMRADILRDRARRVESTNLARAAGGGIVPTAGSPLFVMADNAMQAELDAQRAQYGGKVDAMGYESQADLYNFGASTAGQAGTLRAGSTLLSGASSAASLYRPRGTSGGVDPGSVQAY
jgi:hypothetical protein